MPDAVLAGPADRADLLRRLADRAPVELPVLSIYLDMRPQATGSSPGRRASLTVLRDRFSQIEATLGPRGPELESLQADDERIRTFLDDEFDRAAQGLAIFACHGDGLWETVEAGTPFEDAVIVSDTPQLFQLAQLLDEYETAVVAVVDTNTVRLFLSRIGHFEELDGPDDDPIHYRKRDSGGWSQARFQRHIDNHRADFAAEAASAIESLVERYDARRVLLGGDEVALTPLMEAISPALRERVGEVLRIDMRTPRNEIAAEAEPVLRQMETDASTSLADQVVGAVRGDGLGVAGVAATKAALERGQVDTLVLLASSPVDEDARNELIRLAATTAAEVAVVDEHAKLERLGGVGGLLRYRID
ncbi:MAG: Vms1/Ankzf1 family peptidyl-tRNA hydrolase [Chloroflexota bacterium]